MGSLSKLAFTGALMGYYFGLRGSEICALSIGDVWFERTITVLIWDSKRNASRWIQGVDIPQDVLDYLQEFKAVRKRETGDDSTAKFLGDKEHRKLKRQSFGRIIEKALIRCELSIETGGKQSILHLLRHACANRWLVLGMQIPEISHRLGHKSVDTTVRTYLHSFHFLQAEQLDIYQNTKSIPIWSRKAGAIMLGISTRQLRNLMENQLGKRLTFDILLELFIRIIEKHQPKSGFKNKFPSTII